MGVNRDSYLLYGFKFEDKEIKKVFDDNYDELLDGEYCELFNNTKSEQTIVNDYMSGDYVYIGIELGKLKEYDDDVSVEINKDDMNSLEAKLYKCMESWPDYIVDLCKTRESKLYFFIHAY